MIRQTTLALLTKIIIGAFVVAPAAADDTKPKTISELIRRAEAKLAGGGDVKQTPRETPKGTPKKTEEVDKRPLAARVADAKKACQALIDEKIDEKQWKTHFDALKRLDVVDIPIYLGPLLTGSGHDKVKVRIAWGLLAHYNSEVYGGKPTGQHMKPYEPLHLKYRAWVAARMKAEDGVKRHCKSRNSVATNLAKSLARVTSEDEAAAIKAKLLAAGEESVATQMWQILWARATDMDDDDLRKTKPVGVVATEVFRFYTGVDLDKLRAENRKKLKRKSREALRKNWQNTLRQGGAKVMAKARSNQYTRQLRR